MASAGIALGGICTHVGTARRPTPQVVGGHAGRIADDGFSTRVGTAACSTSPLLANDGGSGIGLGFAMHEACGARVGVVAARVIEDRDSGATDAMNTNAWVVAALRLFGTDRLAELLGEHDRGLHARRGGRA